jgi:hypothetical protein
MFNNTFADDGTRARSRLIRVGSYDHSSKIRAGNETNKSLTQTGQRGKPVSAVRIHLRPCVFTSALTVTRGISTNIQYETYNSLVGLSNPS